MPKKSSQTDNRDDKKQSVERKKRTQQAPVTSPGDNPERLERGSRKEKTRS
jgi:hypothetical protein